MCVTECHKDDEGMTLEIKTLFSAEVFLSAYLDLWNLRVNVAFGQQFGRKLVSALCFETLHL